MGEGSDYHDEPDLQGAEPLDDDPLEEPSADVAAGELAEPDPRVELAHQDLSERAAREFVEAYPELQNEEAVSDLMQRAQETALAMGAPEAAQDLDFLETVHISSGAAAQSAGQRDYMDLLGAGHLGRRALPF